MGERFISGYRGRSIWQEVKAIVYGGLVGLYELTYDDDPEDSPFKFIRKYVPFRTLDDKLD